MTDARRDEAHALMLRFLERDRRYLWTDAFAVCNLVGLGERDRALALVDRVHATLGRFGEDDHRTGWISGLPDAEARGHPTAGGLRIGKPLPERGPFDPIDERLEWDRDGQYFHYLTKWMIALDRVGRRDWARELAHTARRKFVHGRRIYWKMSIDLSRPLVGSMGQHDALDGFVTSLELDLPEEAATYAGIVDPAALATDDALGLGGLLVDAFRLEELARAGVTGLEPMRREVLRAARLGLQHYRTPPARARLAFRELGLAIGLAASGAAPTLRDDIERHWRDPAARRAVSYREHEDINDVMLATCLAPDGFLGVELSRAA